jgi:hypothetical protein
MSIPHLDLMREIQRYIDERILKHTAPYTIDGKINLNSGNVVGTLPRSNGGTGTGIGVSGHVIQQNGTPVYQRPALNFVTTGVEITDNPTTHATDIAINLDFSTFEVTGMTHHTPARVSVLFDEVFGRLETLESIVPTGFGRGGFGRGGFGGGGHIVGGGGGSGGGAVQVNTVSSDYAILVDDYTIVGDTTGGTFSITLPDALTALGRGLEIVRADSSVNDLNVVPSGSDTIDGLSGLTLPNQYDVYTLRSIGTEWVIT